MNLERFPSRRPGDSALSLRDIVEERSMPVTESGCWIWIGSAGAGKSHMPYGDFRRNGEYFTAHRASYQAFKGAIPEGMQVLHRCDVSLCVNPSHLFLGTNAQNIADSMAKGRRKGITRHRPCGLKYRKRYAAA